MSNIFMRYSWRECLCPWNCCARMATIAAMVETGYLLNILQDYQPLH